MLRYNTVRMFEAKKKLCNTTEITNKMEIYVCNKSHHWVPTAILMKLKNASERKKNQLNIVLALKFTINTKQKNVQISIVEHNKIIKHRLIDIQIIKIMFKCKLLTWKWKRKHCVATFYVEMCLTVICLSKWYLNKCIGKRNVCVSYWN